MGKIIPPTFNRIEAILAVGYRVNSTQATEFRKWATTTLNEFIIKGLRQTQRANQETFCNSSKQATLGNHRENRGGDHLYQSRCHQALHGLKNLESSP